MKKIRITMADGSWITFDTPDPDEVVSDLVSAKRMDGVYRPSLDRHVYIFPEHVVMVGEEE